MVCRMCRISSPLLAHAHRSRIVFWGGAPAGEENFSWEVARVYPPLTFGIFGNSTYPYEYFQKILPNMTSGKVPDVSGHSARDPVLNWSTDAASSGPWRSLADC